MNIGAVATTFDAVVLYGDYRNGRNWHNRAFNVGLSIIGGFGYMGAGASIVIPCYVAAGAYFTDYVNYLNSKDFSGKLKGQITRGY